MSRAARAARATLLGVLLLLALGSAGPASAAPCWKKLTLDWAADGAVNETYSIPCYHQAISHLQPDLRIYSSARDDILRALQRATAPTPPKTPVAATTTAEPAAPAPATTSRTPVVPAPAMTTRAPVTKTTPKPKPPVRPPVGRSATPARSDTDSFPLPLVVLGGLAALLLAAGGAGLLWRRFRGQSTA